MLYSAIKLRKSKHTFSGCKVTDNILFSNEKDKNKIAYPPKKTPKDRLLYFFNYSDALCIPFKTT